jgi:hypothetical protein
LEKRGLIVKDQDVTYLKLNEHDTGFDRLQAASTIYRIAFGPRAGEKVFTLRSLTTSNKKPQGLQAAISGFSLHAGVACNKGERKKLEHLCRYISRPPVAEERLRVNERGQVVYKLKRAYDDGTTHIVLSPLEFMERLASLVPRPRVNLSRYHGIFAPHAKYRKLITPKPPQEVATDADKCEAADSDKPKSKYRIHWAQLLKRVFGVDLETCVKCGKKTKIIAAILDPKVVVKILAHLHLPTEPPALAPARGPPIFQGRDPYMDEYSQPSPNF